MGVRDVVLGPFGKHYGIVDESNRFGGGLRLGKRVGVR